MSDVIQVPKLNKPWLVAVWPGMGHVAMSAGYYLMSKLGMTMLAEFSPIGMFEVEHAVVQKGLIRTGALPRSRFFVWKDPTGRHDIIVFIGEAQPPLGKYAFCQRMIAFAKELGVERVLTFASLATPMRPEQPSRVFGAATDEAGLADLRKLGVEVLEEDGQINGLNGLLLAVAGEHGIPGVALLGEMPQIFAQLPFPKAALGVLEVFTRTAKLPLDLSELAEQSQEVERRLEEMMSQIELNLAGPENAIEEGDEEEDWSVPDEEVAAESLSPADNTRIERLFQEAEHDKSKAYVLKKELDRLEAFKDYEDRFLDLFKTAG